MATISVQKPRPLIPAGDHILVLRRVEEKDVESQFARTANGIVTKLLWVFESSEEDENGEPYEHSEWTGTKYGNSKANLTILLDQLIPGITIEDAESLDTDDLVGKRFRARIKHERNDKGDTYPKLVMIEPKTNGAKKRPKPADDEDEKPDPFAKD